MEVGVCIREGEPGPHEYTRGLIGVCAAPHFLYCKFCKRTKREIEILEAVEEIAWVCASLYRWLGRIPSKIFQTLDEETKMRLQAALSIWEKAGKRD